MVVSRPVGCPRPARVRQNPTAPQQAYAPDMPADPTMRRISSAFPALCAASPALPSAIGWATGGPRGALPALPRLVSVSCCGASPLRSAQAPPALAIACRLARRPPPSAAGSLPRFRERAAGLLAERGWKISAATAASSLALWLVLLASVRGVGLSQSEAPWQTTFAAFAFVRLLTVLPVTPGGAGIADLGLVGILAAGADHRVAGQVRRVLLFRAVTYLAPIPVARLPLPDPARRKGVCPVDEGLG